MKTFRELYFKGTPKQLSEFIAQIGEYTTSDWKLPDKTERWKDYVFFDYTGVLVEKARVSIYIGGNEIEKGSINVGNIVPMTKNSLTVDEYNAVLMQFYEDVIKPYKESGTELEISQPSDDIFNPLSVISEDALAKLKRFCGAANKSTGSSHPCDQERWFDFICQTVDDDKMIGSDTLANFLQDEVYWGEPPEGFIGVMGGYAWDEEHAYELASEYESLSSVLCYYKRTRGV
jgi:hypothetical protein